MLSARQRTIYGNTSGCIESRFIREIDKDTLNVTDEGRKEDRETKSTQSFINNMYNSSETTEDIKAGDKVIHNVFGEGVVISINGKIATIAFSHQFGIKQIAINHKYLKKK